MLDKFRTGAKSFGVMLIFGIIIVVFVFWGVGSQDDRIKQIKRMVLEDLVKSKALMQAAEKIGIVVAPQEIRKALDTIPEFHNAEGKFDKDIFQRVLASQRISQDSVLDEIAENITQRKLMLYVQLSAGVNEAEEKSNYMFALEKRKAQYVWSN
jgi:SurA N-terminal domain.